MPVLSAAAAWGLPAAGLAVLLGGETLAVLAAFLAASGILPPVQTACVIFAAAVLSDLFWFFAGRRHPGWPLPWPGRVSPLLRTHRIGLPKRLPGLLFYRVLPLPKSSFPICAGFAKRLSAGRFAALCLFGCLLWTAFVCAAGAAFCAAAEYWTASRISVWNRLPGFLLLLAVLFPCLRYILWHEWEKFFSGG